jgi:hypothetical protein
MHLADAPGNGRIVARRGAGCLMQKYHDQSPHLPYGMSSQFGW